MRQSIKDNLSFNVENYVSESDFMENSSFDLKNSLIISKSKKQLLSDKKLDNKNFLDLSLFPIPLNKLVELINIQLIKLKFKYQSKINIKGYELNLNSKFVSKGDLNLKLTELVKWKHIIGEVFKMCYILNRPDEF